MALTTFDTLKFVRRLQEAGMPVKQAEVQAEVLTEAFNVNLESLVTKEYLDARFAEQNALWDSRFAELSASVDSRLTETNASVDFRFAELKAYVDARFAEQTAEFNAQFRFIRWTLAVLVAGVLLPYLERLAAIT